MLLLLSGQLLRLRVLGMRSSCSLRLLLLLPLHNLPACSCHLLVLLSRKPGKSSLQLLLRGSELLLLLNQEPVLLNQEPVLLLRLLLR